MFHFGVERARATTGLKKGNRTSKVERVDNDWTYNIVDGTVTAGVLYQRRFGFMNLYRSENHKGDVEHWNRQMH
jgi:hypothetical protein